MLSGPERSRARSVPVAWMRHSSGVERPACLHEPYHVALRHTLKLAEGKAGMMYAVVSAGFSNPPVRGQVPSVRRWGYCPINRPCMCSGGRPVHYGSLQSRWYPHTAQTSRQCMSVIGPLQRSQDSAIRAVTYARAPSGCTNSFGYPHILGPAPAA